MTTATKRTDDRKQTKRTPAGGEQSGGQNRDASVEGSGDNRQAGDLDGNRSAGDAKSPGPKSPEVE